MEAFVTLFLAAAWIGIVTVLFWGVLTAWRISHDDEPLPLFSALARRGLRPEALPPGALGTAVRRCVMCAEKDRCRAWLDAAAPGGDLPFCPNQPFLEAVARWRPPSRYGKGKKGA